MSTLFQELKRRNIFRVGLAYGVLAWLLLQVGAIIAPALDLPPWTLPFLIFILAIGLPLVLIFAWAFELTPEGLRKTADVVTEASVTGETGKRLNQVIITVLGLTVVILLGDRFYFNAGPQPEISEATVSPSDQAQPDGAGTSYNSIAVLPFVNMSDDSAQEYFSDGISEELLNLLAKSRDLRVAARTSSFAFKGQNKDIKEIGQQLGVATVLEGSVRNSGTKLRITAQLIETETGYHLWSNTYDRELTDVFAIQDEISSAIVDALQVHLTGGDTPAKTHVTNLETYNAYLKGRHSIDKRTETELFNALTNFDLAAQLDPDYAPAHSGKAEAYMLLADNSYGEIPRQQAYSLAKASLDRALTLEPNLAEALAAQGMYFRDKRQIDESLVSLNRAIELAPNMAQAFLWRAHTYDDLGQYGLARKDIDTAYELNPLFRPVMITQFRDVLSEGPSEEAHGLRERIKKMEGANSQEYYFTDAFWYLRTGELANAFRAGEKTVELGGIPFPMAFSALKLKDPEISLAGIPFRGVQFWWHYSFGNLEAARKALDDLVKKPDGLTPEDLAVREAILLQADGGDASLKRALELAKDLDESFDGSIFGADPDRTEVAEIIALRHQVGDLDSAARLIKQLRAYILEFEGRGFPDVDLNELRVTVKVFDGDLDGAMALLLGMEKTYDLDWTLETRPSLKPLHARDDFQALMDRHYAYINAERAKLGWDPVGREN